jgi:hypothetical protein
VIEQPGSFARRSAIGALKDERMKLHVHLGVHKTATTYLQGRLARNRQGLNRNGVGVMALPEFRQFFTRNFRKFPVEGFRVENHIERFFKDGVPANVRGLILSDENMIGLCNSLIASGKAYQRGPVRLAHLKKLLRGHKVTMFMAIRSYDAFTSSAYCEAMRHTDQFVTFESFRSQFDLEELRWPAMVRRFCEALEPDEVKLWRFEDFRQQSEQVYRELAFGQGVDDVPEDDRVERPSFSGAAVSALEAVASRLGPESAAGLVDSISQALPKGSGKGQYPAFMPWSDADSHAMTRLYDEDCAAIPAKMWLAPPGAPITSGKPKIAAVA